MVPLNPREQRYQAREKVRLEAQLKSATNEIENLKETNIKLNEEKTEGKGKILDLDREKKFLNFSKNFRNEYKEIIKPFPKGIFILGRIIRNFELLQTERAIVIYECKGYGALDRILAEIGAINVKNPASKLFAEIPPTFDFTYVKQVNENLEANMFLSQMVRLSQVNDLLHQQERLVKGFPHKVLLDAFSKGLFNECLDLLETIEW